MTSLDLIANFKSPALQDRHWEELMEKTHQKFDLQEMTLKHLIAMKLYNFEKEIQEIAQTAENEMKIEKQLEEIAEEVESN
jgi:dynein heavy chain